MDKKMELNVENLNWDSDNDDSVDFCGYVRKFSEIFTKLEYHPSKVTNLSKLPGESKVHKAHSKRIKANPVASTSVIKIYTKSNTDGNEMSTKSSKDLHEVLSGTQLLSTEILPPVEEHLDKPEQTMKVEPIGAMHAIEGDGIMVLEEEGYSVST